MSLQPLNSYLLLTPSNWDEWSKTLRAHLMTKGWLSYILKQAPGGDAADIAASLFPTYKANEVEAAAGSVILRAGRDYHYLCYDPSDNALPPKQMWDNLLAKHEKVGASGKVLAILQVTRPYIEGTPIQTHLATMRTQLSHCNAIGMKFETDIQAAFLMASLSPSVTWGDTASTISASASALGEPTFSQVVDKFLVEEQRRQSITIQSGTTDNPSAALAAGRLQQSSSSSQNWKKDNRPIRCTVPNCKTPTTHTNDRCWTYFGYPAGHPKHDPKDWAAKAPLRANASRGTAATAATWGDPIDDDEEDGFAMSALTVMTTEANDPSVLEWKVDSGASRQYCRERSWFSSYTVAPSTVTVANGKIVQVAGHGTIQCLFPSNLGATEHRTIRLLNVQHVPSFAFNLISLPTLDSLGGEARAKDGVCTLLDSKGRILGCPEKGGPLPIDRPSTCGCQRYHCRAPSDELKKWHKRLGHLHHRAVVKLFASNMVADSNCQSIAKAIGPSPKAAVICSACILGNHRTAPFTSFTDTRTSRPLERIFMDV